MSIVFSSREQQLFRSINCEKTLFVKHFKWQIEILITNFCSLCYYVMAKISLIMDLFFFFIITLRAKLSGTVYCNQFCLWVCLCVWVCYHDNSKFRASILTKLGL